jgi:nicotinate phosphoribosyltransferase
VPGLPLPLGAERSSTSERAFYIAGIDATSNVLAGKLYGIPVAGTMAHSYVQAHGDEREAFRALPRRFQAPFFSSTPMTRLTACAVSSSW